MFFFYLTFSNPNAYINIQADPNHLIVCILIINEEEELIIINIMYTHTYIYLFKYITQYNKNNKNRFIYII
jgi:hypothetical protein